MTKTFRIHIEDGENKPITIVSRTGLLMALSQGLVEWDRVARKFKMANEKDVTYGVLVDFLDQTDTPYFIL